MVNRVLTELKLEKHPQKTFIGRAEKCFEFIGFAFGVDTVTIATKTLSNSLTRITRLYEQKAPSQRIWEYVVRFWQWVAIVTPTSEYKLICLVLLSQKPSSSCP